MTAAVELAGVQRDAVEHPLDAGGLVAIEGGAGTGKSVALALRARRAADGLRDGETIVLTAPAALACGGCARSTPASQPIRASSAPNLARSPSASCANATLPPT